MLAHVSAIAVAFAAPIVQLQPDASAQAEEPGPAPTDQAGASIGQAPEDGALFKACIHPVDQFVKPGGQQARQEAGLLFEALARCQQIASARLTRYPHTLAFMHPGCGADNPLGPARVDCGGTPPDQSSFIAR